MVLVVRTQPADIKLRWHGLEEQEGYKLGFLKLEFHFLSSNPRSCSHRTFEKHEEIDSLTVSGLAAYKMALSGQSPPASHPNC